MHQRHRHDTESHGYPPPECSGHIRAITDFSPDWRVAYCTDAKNGQRWEWYKDGKSEPIAGHFAWQYRNAPVPTVEEQGESSIVWAWDDAPGELRSLSTRGGDEDFVILLPEGTGEWLCWFNPRYDPQREVLPDGRIVLIGAHA